MANGEPIQLDTEGADAVLTRQAQLLSPHELAKAGAAAINRGLLAARTVGSRAVRENLALAARTVKDKMEMERATPANLEGRIHFDYSPIPLRDYGATQLKSGVSFRVTKGGGRSRLDEGFIVDSMGGHVFLRAGPRDDMVARLPVEMQFGPSVGSQLERVRPAMNARADKVVGQRLEHEVSRRFEKANRR